MILRSLKTLAKQMHPMQASLPLTERLPSYIHSPCTVDCEVTVRQEHRYYHLNLKISGQLTIYCQRCAVDFPYFYEHRSELAVCVDDDTANRMMSTMDSIVHPEDDLDLIAIATDDLHLFCPEKHENCS